MSYRVYITVTNSFRRYTPITVINHNFCSHTITYNLIEHT